MDVVRLSLCVSSALTVVNDISRLVVVKNEREGASKGERMRDTDERKEEVKGSGMTRVNMVHYVLINSRAPSLDSRIY